MKVVNPFYLSHLITDYCNSSSSPHISFVFQTLIHTTTRTCVRISIHRACSLITGMSIAHRRSYLTKRASQFLFAVSISHHPIILLKNNHYDNIHSSSTNRSSHVPCDLYLTYDRLRSSTVMTSSHQPSHFAAVPPTLSSLSYRFRPVTNTILSDLTDQTCSTSYRIYLPKPNLANHQFARLRSPTQFATVQLLSSISVVLIFPIQMSGLWHRLLQLVIGYPVPWEEHADNVATAFYCRGLAQNITMVGFLGESFFWLTCGSRHKGRLEIRRKGRLGHQYSLPFSPHYSITHTPLPFSSSSPPPRATTARRPRRARKVPQPSHAELPFT